MYLIHPSFVTLLGPRFQPFVSPPGPLLACAFNIDTKQHLYVWSASPLNSDRPLERNNEAQNGFACFYSILGPSFVVQGFRCEFPIECDSRNVTSCGPGDRLLSPQLTFGTSARTEIFTLAPFLAHACLDSSKPNYRTYKARVHLCPYGIVSRV